MSAAEVLAQHQINQWAQHDGWWGCTCDGDVKCDGRHQLDALKAAGYAVVELPAQMTDRANVADSLRALPMWESCTSWACLTAPDCIEFEAAGQTEYGTLTIDEARSLARTLLAATAESVKP